MRCFIWIMALALFCPASKALCQADSIMNLPSPQRFFALYDWQATAYQQDSLLFKKQLEEFRKAFKKQGATDLEKFAFYLANDHISFTHRAKLEERAILDA